MTKPIHVDYGASELATGKVGMLVSAMEENTERLRGLAKGLKEVLNGVMGDAYEGTMNSFNNDLNLYDAAVKRLNGKIDENTRSGGNINQVDIQQGNRFAGLGRV
ncbi:hypothetical protein BJY24_007660 [Nocardia transvalensis]|uniref:WXG100 family type VII secretion target n=1 Tax=Nocardia transvalensis TaxID=37333 RepID=A0A7W9PN96_9NOCA|nr:hypothetical protein [Nocardia transvalensis]MBB5918748.1 hypothetical protein [Nocardia transvalensis]